MKEILVVYPGSFDPPTNGHLDIVSRASCIFSNVVIAITENVSKKHIFTLNKRISLFREITKNFKNVNVTSFSGLLIDYLEKVNSFVLIRGLRALSDFEYEFQMALMNRKLNKKIETIFLMTDQNYTFISSNIIKEVAMLGGNISDFVPICVEKEIKKHVINLKLYKNKKNRLRG